MVKNCDLGLENAARGLSFLVFPPQKLHSNDTLQRDTRGFNAAFSLNSFGFCCVIYGTN